MAVILAAARRETLPAKIESSIDGACAGRRGETAACDNEVVRACLRRKREKGKSENKQSRKQSRKVSHVKKTFFVLKFEAVIGGLL